MALPLTSHDLAINVEPQDLSQLNKMSCAVCIVEDDYHDSFSIVRRCVGGTMRCYEHTMKCANCKKEVDTDAQLLCFACSDSSQASVFHERLSKPAVQEKCYFDKKNEESVWGCGCAKCVENTLHFYLARAVEEGYASSINSPVASPIPSKSEDKVAFGC
jgi:hypothetical protein